MTKIQLLAVALATLSALVSNAVGSELPGPKEKFRIDTVVINGAPNEYFNSASIEPLPDHFSSSTKVEIIKTLPEDLILEVLLKYQGQDVPPFVFPVCPGMSDPVFVSDVVEVGEPKDTFPRACPIQPGNFTVKPWTFPHYKIPPGSPPGPVEVNVYLKQEDKDPIFHLYSTGAVVLDTTDMPKVPEVPKAPFGK